jgi:hypothetical protein
MKEKRILQYIIINVASNGNNPCPAGMLDCSACWLQEITKKYLNEQSKNYMMS